MIPRLRSERERGQGAEEEMTRGDDERKTHLKGGRGHEDNDEEEDCRAYSENSFCGHFKSICVQSVHSLFLLSLLTASLIVDTNQLILINILIFMLSLFVVIDQY